MSGLVSLHVMRTLGCLSRIPPVLLLILFTSSRGLRHRLSRLHWTGFIIINLGLSCLITHTWFPFPLISTLYMCPLFPLSLSVTVHMSVGRVSTYALVQLAFCMLYILYITGIVPCCSSRFTLVLLFGYSPVFLYTVRVFVLLLTKRSSMKDRRTKTQRGKCSCFLMNNEHWTKQ